MGGAKQAVGMREKRNKGFLPRSAHSHPESTISTPTPTSFVFHPGQKRRTLGMHRAQLVHLRNPT